jgi:hypothetical protein
MSTTMPLTPITKVYVVVLCQNLGEKVGFEHVFKHSAPDVKTRGQMWNTRTKKEHALRKAQLRHM